MSEFSRNLSSRWHDEVPGSRWYHSDLHIHTIDDHWGNAKLPSGVSGDPADHVVQNQYVRQFLQAAIVQGVEVLGLTPHCVKSGDQDDSSATWRIIEEWNTGTDDDGTPFRDKIYSIFPGFETNLNDGSHGIHLIFLFDPEIGRETYLNTFTTIMGAMPPWLDGKLQMSGNDARSAFRELDQLVERLENTWDYVCLAPHSFSDHGIFRLKSQVLQLFEHHSINGLELGDNMLPSDAHESHDYLREGMKKYHHSFFHSSDAYKITEIGKRITLLKLATPRIESLRQAFLASDSRLRIPYYKDESDSLQLLDDMPSAIPLNRSWLHSVHIKGGASFFGGTDEDGTTNETIFRFNPDLTCIIGPRMSGKSTLLDGLRLYTDHDLPRDEETRRNVLSRAENVFLPGGPEISITVKGPVPATLDLNERWPAVFYTQRELRAAADNPDVLNGLLYRLLPDGGTEPIEREQEISELSKELWDSTDEIYDLREELSVAESSLEESESALKALVRFEDAGVSLLTHAQSELASLSEMKNSIDTDASNLQELLEISKEYFLPEKLHQNIKASLVDSDTQKSISDLLDQYRSDLESLQLLQSKISTILVKGIEVSNEYVSKTRKNVLESIVEAGGNAEELSQFDSLSDLAGRFDGDNSAYNQARSRLSKSLFAFLDKRHRRQTLIDQQRASLNGLREMVNKTFKGKIRIRTVHDYRNDDLDNWIQELAVGGITKWWKTRNAIPGAAPTPRQILQSLALKSPSLIDMTPRVWQSFEPLMSDWKKDELRSLCNNDQHIIELNVEPEGDNYKEIRSLSGGAQAGVLLSLLLESDDQRPLVIDQPEEELDKSYLAEQLLPSLRRSKGHRQIIFSTHDANIVVNADADQVIHLEATHDHGRIEREGAIDNPLVRDSIIKVVDGGYEAFKMRGSKYGF